MNSTTEVAKTAQEPSTPDPETVAYLTRSWPDLLKTPLIGPEESIRLKNAIDLISVPARVDEIATEVVSLIVEYFVKYDREGLARLAADRWQNELEGQPLWAIKKASAWWTSRHNDRRDRKPLPGDISQRAFMEMEIVRFAQRMVDRAEQAERAPKTPVRPGSYAESRPVIEGPTAQKIVDEAFANRPLPPVAGEMVASVFSTPTEEQIAKAREANPIIREMRERQELLAGDREDPAE